MLPTSVRLPWQYTRVGSYLIFLRVDQPQKSAKNKHSSLFCPAVCDEEKSVMALTPGPSVMKLFTAVIYKYS